MKGYDLKAADRLHILHPRFPTCNQFSTRYRYTIYKYIASLVIPLSDFFRPSIKDFGENFFGWGCDGINGLLSGVPWMMVEITGNSGVSSPHKKKNVRQQPCAVSVMLWMRVIAISRSTLRRSFLPVLLTRHFGIVFDWFSINLGSIILHDAWISLCKYI